MVNLRRMRAVLLSVFWLHQPFGAAGQSPQSEARDNSLSLSDAYKVAMKPFLDARSAPNDFTEADQWAMSLTIARARRFCDTTPPNTINGEDLLILGKLCLLGQDFEPARAALVTYLSSPDKRDERAARLQLATTYLRMHWVTGAEEQVGILLKAFKYDSEIEELTNNVIEAAYAGYNFGDWKVIGRLSSRQWETTVAAIEQGKSSLLLYDSVRDGIRYATYLRTVGEMAKAADIIEALRKKSTSEQAGSSSTTDLDRAIGGLFARYQLLGLQLPREALVGRELVNMRSPDTTIVRNLHSDRRNTVFLFCSLSSPQVASVIRRFGEIAAKEPALGRPSVFAVTSYEANGSEGAFSKHSIVSGLRQFVTRIQPIPLVIVPKSVLDKLRIDEFPAVALIGSDRRILVLDSFSGSDGCIRKILFAGERPHERKAF